MCKFRIEVNFDATHQNQEHARKIRETMEEYFSQFPENQDFKKFGRIRFRVMEESTGTRHLALVEAAPGFAPTIKTGGIRAKIRIEGGFWAWGFIYCDQRQHEMGKLIADGPPQKDKTILVKEQEISQLKKELTSLLEQRAAAELALKRAQERTLAAAAKVEERIRKIAELEEQVIAIKEARLAEKHPAPAQAEC